MILISIIIFYLILNLKTIKKKKINQLLSDLNFLEIDFKTLKYYYNILVMLSFIIIYIILFRLLKIFIKSKYINLKEVFIFIEQNSSFVNFYILLILLLLYLELKGLFIFILKRSFFELVYLFQAKFSFFPKLYAIIVTWQHHLWHWIISGNNEYKNKKQILRIIFYFFKYIGFFILFISFCYDLVYNNYILVMFCTILPFFGLYQTIYIINQFFDKKVDLELDYYTYSFLYLKFLHRRFFYEKYKEEIHKISFEIYYNIQYNILNNKPPEIDNFTLNKIKNYIYNLFK